MKIRPFLKWAGGKYRIIPIIRTYLPKGNRLIEPFVGAGSIFFNTDYPGYLLSDNNADLIHLYQMLKLHQHQFIHECQSYFTKENNQAETFYRLREMFNQTNQVDSNRAALFFYLNRHGFNGLCRYNQKGKFNVPFGRYKQPIFPKNSFDTFLAKANRTTFLCQDFITTMKMAKKGDVIYCDPPYASIDSNNVKNQYKTFANYCAGGFGTKEQTLLAETARTIAHRGIPVLISNHDTQFTREIYQGATIFSFEAPRSISRNIYNRRSVKELLAIF